MRSLNFRFLRQKPLYVSRFWLQNSEVLTKALVLKKVPGWASSDKSLRSRRHGENKEGHGSKLSGKKKKYCWTVSEGVSFEWSHHRISSTDSKARITLCGHNKQYHRKVLLISFHLNGHTIGFVLRVRSWNYCLWFWERKVLPENVAMGWFCGSSKYHHICLILSLIVIFVFVI